MQIDQAGRRNTIYEFCVAWSFGCGRGAAGILALFVFLRFGRVLADLGVDWICFKFQIFTFYRRLLILLQINTVQFYLNFL